MSIDTVIYNQDAIEYHVKILVTPFDGSEINRIAKENAAKYLRGWIIKLLNFASLSDTKASKCCKESAERLQALIKLAQKIDGIKW